MPKVDSTAIIIAKKKAEEVSVGDVYGKVTISQIDVTPNATYIYVKDEDEKETAYGAKIFLNKFKA